MLLFCTILILFGKVGAYLGLKCHMQEQCTCPISLDKELLAALEGKWREHEREINKEPVI